MTSRLRRSPRLRNFDYIGPLAAHLTFVTRGRARFFREPTLSVTCIESLDKASSAFGVEVNAFCLMPDHLHLLVTVPEGVALPEFVRRFKQLSGYAVKQQTGVGTWQTSYYDHVVRKEESLLDLARYIWDNPVRKGLVAERFQYPYSGPRDLMQI